ncbi:hypothetical protein [Mangrovibacillus cuniculi]|uniref:SWIM-type domain-containing protein n=1 Tax=Mangrovibacillus cuniculi TaxID=2593652 RepID=A0A7S8CCX9_9BACI|nr:hypothetical protein [Mangrovibacillus cuniculi]QPC47679.1 hypothetical protein G8O30_12295 [Mangrovibacillus cuniculi]
MSLSVKIERVAPMLDDLAKELRNQLDYANDHHQRVVQKGLLLYRQRLVYQVKIGEQYMEGSVQDAVPVHTQLHLIQPYIMNCSCPSQGICRHQMALFFHVYSQVRSVNKWMEDWKKESNLAIQDLFDSLRGKANDLLVKRQEQAASGSVLDQWLKRMEDMFDDLMTQRMIENPYVLEMEVKQLYRRIGQFAPTEREWIPMYYVVSALFLYKKILLLLEKLNQLEQGSRHPVHRFVVQLSDDVVMNISRLSASALPFAFDEILAYVRQESYTLLEPQTFSPVISFEMYRELWKHLFTKSEWRMEEDKRLSDIENRTFMQVAGLICIKLIRKQDAEAHKLMTTLGHDSLVFATDWINLLDNSMDRIMSFIKHILPFIPDHIAEIDNYYEQNTFARSLISSIDRFQLRDSDFTVFDELLYELLPFSERILSTSFIERKQFRRWTEFLMSQKMNVYELHPDEVKVVEKEDPLAVLPIFHCSINYFIGQKNRQSYKDAVRLIKRTKKVYKVLQKSDMFDYYFDALMEEHKRLRAFQEECRKGKLLHA